MEYVYILTNSNMKGVVKIGKTKKHPEIRANQLTRYTGTFGEYKVEWFKEVNDSAIAEKLLHYAFRDFYFQKEFFVLEKELAIKIASEVIQNLEILEAKIKVDIDRQVKGLEEAIEGMKVAIEFSNQPEGIIKLKNGIKDLEEKLKRLKKLEERTPE